MTPRSAGPVAAASPAMPAPTTTARGRDSSRPASRSPCGAGCFTRRASLDMRLIRQERVHDVALPARHRLAVDRGEPGVGQPPPETRGTVEREDTAPQMPIQGGVAGLPPARRDD